MTDESLTIICTIPSFFIFLGETVKAGAYGPSKCSMNIPFRPYDKHIKINNAVRTCRNNKNETRSLLRISTQFYNSIMHFPTEAIEIQIPVV